ncbi:hypothetical protein [Rhizobium sp. MHM7A]|uniref:hypothetical protein n=1 Tax=Rhizobium sp. MHM7A TaxID=2583233 RepID=UPI0011075B94|nr:hypothetical protein [Rhizobium sp. MHM7A]TLX16603.1 hypothetical protein FFR93_04485 [Rhizobium sp. MHM7A]
MGYRNITVNNKRYQYSVGRSGVHIKLPQGGAIYADKRQIGIDRGDDKFAVTPACIRSKIEELEAKTSM